MMKRNVEYFIYFMSIFIVFVAFFGSFFAPFDPDEIDLANKFSQISSIHLLGTDHLGRDEFSRILYGAGLSLKSTFLTLVLILFSGVSIGFIAAFGGGKVDNFLMRICDIFLSFPTIVLALFFIGIFGTGLINVIIAIAITHFAWYARIVRSIVLKLKNKEYVLISKTSGANSFDIFAKHFFLPISSQLIVLATLDLGHIMLHISGLSLLGLGVKAPEAEWGLMISEAKEYIFSHYELILYPGIAMLIVIVVFNMLGDILRDKLSPYIEVKNAY